MTLLETVDDCVGDAVVLDVAVLDEATLEVALALVDVVEVLALPEVLEAQAASTAALAVPVVSMAAICRRVRRFT
ncbi:MAG: hypothetical protein M1118_01010 [Chloroflexi bacterium]|nr:hypothetical protein [Chloroflexota bacterium]